MSKHTPGPWTMRESNFAFHIYGVFKKSKNAFITAAYWRNADYGASRTEAEANARLIAAAPEMLNALKYIVGCSIPLTSQQEECWKAMREAIAKAEGEAHCRGGASHGL